MCFHSKQSASALALKQRFNAIFENEIAYQPTTYNGFEHPKTPIITSQKQNTIQLYSWGLIPHWAKDDSIQQYTLNAKIETMQEKPSFRDVIQNRCLVLIDGFYEWKWLDEKGKHKQKYLISLPTHEAFACAGLYSHWTNKNTGETINTYTILTTEANELMSEIHNSKKRMPVIIHSSNEQSWLLGAAHKFTHINLMATEV